MAVIALPRILNERLTEEGARAFVEIIDKVEERSQKVTLEMAEERFEKRLTEVKSELKNDIAEVKSELKSDIAKVRADLIKWMFIFIMGQFWAIVGVLFAFFHH